MAKQSFLLVSLQEDKAKKLAQVVSNDSCRKILDYLTDKEATETELAEKLGLPLSTVHYNLKHLQDSGLVTVEEFHYSEKGKEVNHYRLANKYIIIAPKSTFGIKEKLKSILPAGLIALGGAFLVSIFGRSAGLGSIFADQAPAMMKTAAQEAASIPAALEMHAVAAPSLWQNIGVWFLLGALFAFLAYLIVSYLRKE